MGDTDTKAEEEESEKKRGRVPVKVRPLGKRKIILRLNPFSADNPRGWIISVYIPVVLHICHLIVYGIVQ